MAFLTIYYYNIHNSCTTRFPAGTTFSRFYFINYIFSSIFPNKFYWHHCAFYAEFYNDFYINFVVIQSTYLPLKYPTG